MGVGSGRQWVRAPPPWIFIHDTDIVDRGLKVLFFGLFSVFPLCKRLKSAAFGLFSVGLPGNFSADALGCEYQLLKSFGLNRQENRTQIYPFLAQKY